MLSWRSQQETRAVMEKSEFTVMGKTMEQVTVFYGAFLIVWAVLVTLLGQSESWTSLIPALFGLPIGDGVYDD